VGDHKRLMYQTSRFTAFKTVLLLYGHCQ